MIKTLEDFSRRVDELQARIDGPQEGRGQVAEEREPWLVRVPQHPCATPGNAHQPPQSRRGPKEVYAEYQQAKRELVRRQPAAGRLDRQEVPQPRPELPGPDPGRQRRPDAGGGQVRVPPRLQVLHLRHLVDSPGHHPRRGRPEPHDPHSGAHGRNHVAGAERLAATAAGAGSRADDRRDRRAERARRSTKPGACWP